MADPRERLLGPVDTGHNLLGALGEGPLIFLEPIDAAPFPGALTGRMFARFHVPLHRHEIGQLVGEPLGSCPRKQ